MLKSPKQKGSRLEREVAERIRSSGLDKTASRMPLSGAMECLKSDIFTKLPISVECKNQESWKPLEYLNQAKSGAKQNEIPVVIMSKNRLPEPIVMLELKDFIWILQLAKESGGLTQQYGYTKRKQTGK